MVNLSCVLEYKMWPPSSAAGCGRCCPPRRAPAPDQDWPLLVAAAGAGPPGVSLLVLLGLLVPLLHADNLHLVQSSQPSSGTCSLLQPEQFISIANFKADHKLTLNFSLIVWWRGCSLAEHALGMMARHESLCGTTLNQFWRMICLKGERKVLHISETTTMPTVESFWRHLQ